MHADKSCIRWPYRILPSGHLLARKMFSGDMIFFLIIISLSLNFDQLSELQNAVGHIRLCLAVISWHENGQRSVLIFSR